MGAGVRFQLWAICDSGRRTRSRLVYMSCPWRAPYLEVAEGPDAIDAVASPVEHWNREATRADERAYKSHRTFFLVVRGDFRLVAISKCPLLIEI